MSAVMSPIMIGVPSVKAGGAINSGGFIYTYLAGTTTLADTWTDNTLVTLNANPITLNSYGLAPQEIWWNSGIAMKFIVKDSAGNTIGTYDNLAGLNDPTSAATVDEWVPLSQSPTYISATSFSVEGNQTAALQVGRQIKTTNTGGTAYSTITSSGYVDPTNTVVVRNVSGALDSGISAVSYALLSATNPSLPFIGPLYELSTNTFSSSASSIFTLDTTTYNGWLIRLINVRPATDAVNLLATIGTGGSFDAGTNYNWGRNDVSSAGIAAASGAAGTSSVQAAQSVGNGAGECVNGYVYVSNLTGSVRLQWELTWVTAAGTFTRATGGAEDTNGSARDQVKFAMSSGNITSGSMTIYGFPA